MKRLALLVTVFATMAVSAGPVNAQGNYVPVNYDTLPRMPGCDWWPSETYPGTYEAWCGSDELGWYRPTEWGRMYGMNPGDYGYGG